MSAGKRKTLSIKLTGAELGPLLPFTAPGRSPASPRLPKTAPKPIKQTIN